MKKLIKSYKFWTALAGSVGMLVVGFNNVFNINISVAGVKETIMAICGVLIGLGIVKKPTSETNSVAQSEQSKSEQNNQSIEEIDLSE